MENTVEAPLDGLIIAVQFWAGDEAAALRLARLLADIEVCRRRDVTLALCHRNDLDLSIEAQETLLHCGRSFRVMALRSERVGAGHPDGCNALWAGTMDKLAAAWAEGHAPPNVLFVEADGAPCSCDWLSRLMREHAETLQLGKRVTGAFCESSRPDRLPHINGSMMLHLSIWADRLSLHQTPPGHAWDLFHRHVLLAEARPTTLIKNVYGAKDLAPALLEVMSRETAWLSNVKDDSVTRWAERTLVANADPFGGPPL